ncbi:hypothetical protein [Gimesia aquarii]|uniref:Uncharacterized protein n=1 Tax=Gimesia aquarii TaxID=2527964 RepID=A0A517W3S8_9PLAN|nr:hypothetical protein [Gimesia aquarii]QDT99880.1 hypothetical protein V144x_53940 [Gimesia aquarii]
MHAYLSAQLSMAVVVSDNQWQILSYNDLHKLRDTTPTEAASIFRSELDIQVLYDTTIPQVRDSLEDAVDSLEAFNLVLLLLDDSFTLDTQSLVIEELEELLTCPDIVENLENIFFASPLQVDFNNQTIFAMCSNLNCESVSSFIRHLDNLQPMIKAVWTAWNQIDLSLFASDHEQRKICGLFVRNGVFKRIVYELSITGTVTQIDKKFPQLFPFDEQYSSLKEILHELTIRLCNASVPKSFSMKHTASHISMELVKEIHSAVNASQPIEESAYRNRIFELFCVYIQSLNKNELHDANHIIIALSRYIPNIDIVISRGNNSTKAGASSAVSSATWGVVCLWDAWSYAHDYFIDTRVDIATATNINSASLLSEFVVEEVGLLATQMWSRGIKTSDNHFRIQLFTLFKQWFVGCKDYVEDIVSMPEELIKTLCFMENLDKKLRGVAFTEAAPLAMHDFSYMQFVWEVARLWKEWTFYCQHYRTKDQEKYQTTASSNSAFNVKEMT